MSDTYDVIETMQVVISLHERPEDIERRQAFCRSAFTVTSFETLESAEDYKNAAPGFEVPKNAEGCKGKEIHCVENWVEKKICYKDEVNELLKNKPDRVLDIRLIY